jgi:CHAT domain-containing protein
VTGSTLKDLSEAGQLADYAIVQFATHGALAGQVAAEQGLILTPPAKRTINPNMLERDDGFLATSEIATLKLDADWAGGSDAYVERYRVLPEPSSMPARVHCWCWEVVSDAAVMLTTRAIPALKAHPNIGRAEVFRLSMKELIEKGKPAEAHPSMWASFVVVGEEAH